MNQKLTAQTGAYHLGSAAERYGRPIDSCPYKKSDFVKAWKQGWKDSRRARFKR